MDERTAPTRIVKSTDKARQGVTWHNVRYVLIAGLLSVIIVFGLLWFYVSR